MSSPKSNHPSDDFLEMFDALLLVESVAEAKDLVRHSDLIENIEFHETEINHEPDEQESP